MLLRKGLRTAVVSGAVFYDWTRVLHTTWNMAKNQAQLIMCGRAWGSLDKISGGAAEAHRRGGDAVKSINDTALVVSTTHHRVRGLAWRHDATPPYSMLG